MTSRIRLGELLVRAGVIDDMQLKAALAEQHRWGGRLGRVLVDMAFVSEEILVKALSKQLGVERADLSKVDVPNSIIDKISVDFAQSHSLCPVRYDAARRVLVVATADPTNVAALDELRFKTGLRIETALGGEHEIHIAIQRYLQAAHGIEFDVPDAIELSEDIGEQVLIPNDDYAAAMAASGVPVLSGRPGAGVSTPEASVLPGRPVPQTPLDRAPAPPPPAASAYPPVVRSPGMGVPPLNPPPPAPFSPPPLNPPPPRYGPDAGPPSVPSSDLGSGLSGSLDLGGGANPGAGSALDMAQRLEGAQKQQHKALRAMVELLIDKGVISRDEYIARVTPKR